MPERIGQIYCQRCLAPNALGQELCGKCGTRLMLVVEPSSLRFEDETAGADTSDEHLLERITMLESNLGRVIGRLEQTLDLFLRQTRTTYLNHLLLESLIAVLSEKGTVNPREVQRLWRELSARDDEEKAQGQARDKLCARVVKAYGGPEQETFAGLVREGFAFLGKNDIKRAVRTLERASALAPDNSPLNAFLGEHFFRARKTTLARDYLERALSGAKGDGRVRLLLGLVCGDEGDIERAKVLLSEALDEGGPRFAAHYALGRLLAAEGDLKAALAAFKRALGVRRSAEAHFVVGAVYHQLNKHRTALRFLSGALEIDPNYAEAHYLSGLARLALGEREQAAESFAAAQAADREEPRYRAARQRLRRSGNVPPVPLFGVSPNARKRLVTGGDRRLAVALQEDALGGSLAR